MKVNDTVTPRLQRLARGFDDLSHIFRRYGAYQDGATDDLFKNEQDPYGSRWADLKPSTLEQKRRRNAINKKLQFTGSMRATTSSKPGRRDFVHGFNDSKVRFHDLGTRKMAKRQVLPDESRGLPDKSTAELERLADNFTRRVWS